MKKQKDIGKRILAVTLSILMVTSIIDYSGFINVCAQTTSDKESITSFVELPEDINNKINEDNIDDTVSENVDNSISENSKSDYQKTQVNEVSKNSLYDNITWKISATEGECAFCESKIIDNVEIMVKAEQGVFPEGAILYVEKVVNPDQKEKIENVINNEVTTENFNENIEDLVAFDITIMDEVGNEIQPDTSKGNVKVSFERLSMTENGAIVHDGDIQVFHMDETLSNAEKLESSVSEEGVVEVLAEHFSVYAITETTDTPDTDTMTTLYINKGNITIGDGTVRGIDPSGTEITTANSNGYIIAMDPYSGSKKYTVTVVSGEHNIVLRDTEFYLDEGIVNSPFSIESGAKVNLVLEGSNYLRNRSQVAPAALHVPEGAELVIAKGSTGSMTAFGGPGAGIGGNDKEACGIITINGGTLSYISGGPSGAGIGGGRGGDGGTITINGGNLTDIRSSSGAGIGGGAGGSGGNITINGGTINAKSSMYGAGIGGGEKGAGGSLTICGGIVTATGSSGAGIGGGYGGARGILSSGGNFVSINASRLNTDTSGFNGVVANDGNKTVYGSYELLDNTEIVNDKTIMLNSNSSLIVPDGMTLTVNGTLNYTNGTFINNGTLAGTGTLIPALDVDITGENKEISFADTVSLNTLFIIPSGAGSATYILEDGGTGVGTISDNILSVSKTGTFLVTVNTAPTGFYKAGSKTMALTIQNKSINDSDINIVSYTGTYDGASHDALTITGVPVGTNVSYCDSVDGVFSSECPQVRDVSDTGKYYYVKISGDNYDTWTGTVSEVINILPISVSYSGITTTGKTYDGTSVVGSEWDISKAVLTGILDADKDIVSLSIDNERYESPNAGNTRILFDAFLTGAGSENYRLQKALENGSVETAIAKKELMVALNTQAQIKANNLQLGDSVPSYSQEDLIITGYVNDETQLTAGIDSTNLAFVFSQNDTNNLLTDGTISISGLNSINYSFAYNQGSLNVGKKVFEATPYTVTGSHNGKSGNERWYNETITIVPNVSAGNFTYINISTDGGLTWYGWGTFASISTDINSINVKIKLSTGANGEGAVLISDDVTTSNLEGMLCRLDTVAPSYPDNPVDIYGINIKNSWWRNLLSTITFGNFFNETQVITIAAKEDGSGIAETYFYKALVTNKSGYIPLTSAQLDALSRDKWVSSCTVAPDDNYVVYAYVVDKAGNKSSYICTDGLVLDVTAPIIQNVSTNYLLDVSAELNVMATDSNGIAIYTSYVSENTLALENQTPFYIKTNGTSRMTGTISMTGLSANTTYYYYIVAEDEAGNTSLVKNGSFKTTMTQPMNVTVPTVVAVKYGTKVSDITLVGGSAKQSDGTTNLAGVWRWSDANRDSNPAVGSTKAYEVTFTPSDSDYASVIKTIVPIINAVEPTIILADSKSNIYNGNEVFIGLATVTGATFIGAEAPVGIVNYTYYMDESCTSKTGTDFTKGGAIGEGHAPVNAGTYYVKATIGATGSYTEATSEKATLVIGKATPTIMLKGTISREYNGEATIVIPKNGSNGYSSNLTAMPIFTFYTDEACTILTDIDSAKGLASGTGKAPVNAGTYYIKASYMETDNYSGVTSTEKMTYIISQTEQIIVGTRNYTKTYGDSSFVLDATRTVGDGNLSYTITKGNGVISVDSTGQVTIIKAGSASVLVKASETNNATAKNFEVTLVVNKALLNITSYTVSDKDYDGTTEAEVLEVNFSGYVKSEGSFTSGIDYTAEAVFVSKDAGTHKVTGTVALKTGSTLAQNYYLPQNTLSGEEATIRTIALTYSISPQNITINKKLIDINANIKALGVKSEVVEGNLTWSESDGGTVLTDNYCFVGSENTQLILYWVFTPSESGSGNYKAVKGSTVFTLTTKEVPKLNVENLLKIYDGENVTVSSLMKIAKVDGTAIAGSFSFVPTTQELKKVGSYKTTVQFIPEDTTSYTNASTDIIVTINKRNAEIEVRLSKQNLSVGEELPNTYISYDNVVSGESLVPTTAAIFIGMPADSNTANTYHIIWSNKEVMKSQIDMMEVTSNYNITYHTTTDFNIQAKKNSDDKDGNSGNKDSNNNANKTAKNQNTILPNLTGTSNILKGTSIIGSKFANADKKESGKPFIQGKIGVEGWSVIKEQVLKEVEGSSVRVDMNGARVVPGDVLQAIKGKDITYVFDIGNGITWSINGGSIISDNIKDIDFEVVTGMNTIPADIISSIVGEDYALNLSLAYHGTFGFTAILNINLNKENAGHYANLYYYNEQIGELEFIESGKIDEDGNAKLTFTHASEYIIVVSKESMDGSSIGSKQEVEDNEKMDNKTENKMDTPIKEKGWNPLWFMVIGTIIILIGGVAVFSVNRKKEEV